MKFSGIVFKDEYGNDQGTYGGTDDNDWNYDSTWSQEIWDLLDFNDTVSLSGTYLNSSYDPPQQISFYLFPNPVADEASAYILVPGNIKIKMALADHQLKSVSTYCYKGRDTSWVRLVMEDTNTFVEGEVYRLYYTFSVLGRENFYKGHGDVLMCYNRPSNLCLSYLDE
jgi:hypothetical protein